MISALLALLLLLSGVEPAHAEDGDPRTIPQGRAVAGDQTKALEEMRRRLEKDPGLQEALVERILQSKIAGVISKETDQNKKASDVRAWIEGDLGSAAEIALGLSDDDEQGTRRFENTLVSHLVQTYARNPNAEKGAYGALKNAAKQSKTIAKVDQDVSEEQRREELRTLFDGKGAQDQRVITPKPPEGKLAAEQAPTSALASSFYDRLSAGNIRGYSPQLLAMQNALNLRRPPGAPLLIETGKLDFATLSYPAYGLRYDLGNLENRLSRQSAGQENPSALRAPDHPERNYFERMSKRLSARQAMMDKARAALTAFEAAASRSKNPNNISKDLLVELAGHQREAARWITAASLEEDLVRVEAEEDFLSAELLAQINAVPAPAAVREAYKRRGEQLKARLVGLMDNARQALDDINSDSWLSKLGQIEKRMKANQALRRNLSADISDYRLVPYHIGKSLVRQARWRTYLDNLIVKYAAKTSYGRAVAARRDKLARLLVLFGQIASGDTGRSTIDL
jgi:hypothetical protein